MPSFFLEFSLILLTAVVSGLVCRKFSQPLIVGYLLAGLLISPLGFLEISQSTLSLFASLGVAFLLFMVGLELNIKEIQRIGPGSFKVGLWQVLISAVLAFVLGRLLGLAFLPSFYLALALSFSSTIVVVKTLQDQGELQSLSGRSSVGILIVQDLLAIVFLMVLGVVSQSSGGFNLPTLFLALFKAFLFLAFVYLLAVDLLPLVFRYLARSVELLTLGAVSLALLLASLSQLIGFPPEVGAFLAGLSMSDSPYLLEVSAKIRPLRDFFLIMFFIGLGSLADFQGLLTGSSFSHKLPLILCFVLLLLFTLLIKPLVIFLLMLAGNHKARTAFLTAVSLSQTSEFSFHILQFGQSLGVLVSPLVSLFVLAGIVSIGISASLTVQSKKLYRRLGFFLKRFESAAAKAVKDEQAIFANHVILFGCHRMGSEFLKVLEGLAVPTVVVDFDPATIERIAQVKQECPLKIIYGDAGDSEILNELNLDKARLVISSVPDFDDNLVLLSEAKRINPKLPVVLTAASAQEAKILYENGATYVIIPHILTGQAMGGLLKDYLTDLVHLAEAGRHHRQTLEIGN